MPLGEHKGPGILDDEGLKLLLIGQNVAPVLGERTLDYREMGQGMRFILT
jgi:hypothetical protein